MCVCVCVEGRAYLSSNDDQRAFDSNLLQLGRPNLRFLDQSVVVSSAQSTISGEHDQSDLLHWADGNQGAVNILVCDSEVDAVQNLFSHSVKMRKKRESITTAPSLFIRHIYIYASRIPDLDKILRERSPTHDSFLRTAYFRSSDQLHRIRDLLSRLHG